VDDVTQISQVSKRIDDIIKLWIDTFDDSFVNCFASELLFRLLNHPEINFKPIFLPSNAKKPFKLNASQRDLLEKFKIVPDASLKLIAEFIKNEKLHLGPDPLLLIELLRDSSFQDSLLAITVAKKWNRLCVENSEKIMQHLEKGSLTVLELTMMLNLMILNPKLKLNETEKIKRICLTGGESVKSVCMLILSKDPSFDFTLDDWGLLLNQETLGEGLVRLLANSMFKLQNKELVNLVKVEKRFISSLRDRFLDTDISNDSLGTILGNLCLILSDLCGKKTHF
jgi:hypothetical protein